MGGGASLCCRREEAVACREVDGAALNLRPYPTVPVRVVLSWTWRHPSRWTGRRGSQGPSIPIPCEEAASACPDPEAGAPDPGMPDRSAGRACAHGGRGPAARSSCFTSLRLLATDASCRSAKIQTSSWRLPEQGARGRRPTGQ